MMVFDYSQIAIYLLFSIGVFLLIFMVAGSYKRRKKLEKLGLFVESEKSTNERLESIGQSLSVFFSASQEEMIDRFNAAGLYNSSLAFLFFPLKYTLLAFGLAIVVLLFLYFDLEFSKALLGALFWIIVVIILPDAYLALRAKRVRERISTQLPYLLDLMAVCIQTGMTIESSMAYLAMEMMDFDKDLAYMLRKTNDRARIVGLGQALDELYKRIPTQEVRSFVMTINQSLQYGSSIYNVLITLAVDIRETQMLGLEEKVGKLSAKMSPPLVLFIMFPVVILIVAPGIMRMM